MVGFNGAASQRTRKYPLKFGALHEYFMLQWGRVTEDAEMKWKARGVDLNIQASMGPRHRGRGNLYALTLEYTYHRGLQWGRVTEDAEIAPSACLYIVESYEQ